MLAALSALLLLPVIDAPSSWPFLALAFGAALLASPLPCVLAAAGAALVALLVRLDGGGVLLTGALVATLGCVLVAHVPAVPPAENPRAARETALAVALTWLAVALAGWEGWRAEGTYFCRSAAGAAAAGLFGFGGLAPTGLPGTRRLLLLVALAAAVLFPEALP